MLLRVIGLGREGDYEACTFIQAMVNSINIAFGFKYEVDWGWRHCPCECLLEPSCFRENHCAAVWLLIEIFP